MLSLIHRDARLSREKHLASVLDQLRADRSAQRKLKRQIARLAKPRRSPTPDDSTSTTTSTS